MWKLLLKKLGMSVITVLVFFVGAFGYGLVIAPFNLPYLLKLPAEANEVFGAIFMLVFVCVVTVIVRADWCIEEDMFCQDEDEQRPLFWRVLISCEFLADVIVFAVEWLVFVTVIGVTSGEPWFSVALGVVLLVLGATAAFAVLDCLLYIIARKRADHRLRKLQRKREQ